MSDCDIMESERISWAVFLHGLEGLCDRLKALFPDDETISKPREILDTLSQDIFGDQSRGDYAELISEAGELVSGDSGSETVKDSELRMVAIFRDIRKDGDSSTPGENFFLPLAALSESESMFPVKQSQTVRKDDTETFKSLVERLFNEIKTLTHTQTNPDFETFFYAVQKYLWCIPHETGDISLFEHLKLTAAVASIIHDESTCGLVGFDISGIQEFIYTIASKRAAKTLKGRSFYLQLLEMAIIRLILDRLELDITHVVYVGGGKGIVLAPEPGTSKLQTLEAEINDFLFDRLDAKVFVGVACEPFEKRALKTFSTIMEGLFAKLNRKKRQKFSMMLDDKPTDMYPRLFNPEEIEIDQLDSCSICGKEGKPAEVDDENDLRWCGQCITARDLGAGLRSAAAIAETTEPGRHGGNEVVFVFGETTYAYRLLSKEALDSYSPDNQFLYCLNDTGLFTETLGKGWRTGFMFYAGNRVPLKKDENGNGRTMIEFDDVANQSLGSKKLGVVRGDVDGLGTVFSRCLGGSGSLVRTSQLSFLLKLFFSSMANLYFKHDEYQMIIYSGGDDFFVIGPWNRVIDSLVEFRKAFTRYTCGNPLFSFSASFVMVHSRYPTFKFAEVAGDCEERAKENKVGELEKDSICFLNRVVFWRDFFPLQELQKELCSMLDEKVINRSYIDLLRRITQYNNLEYLKTQIFEEPGKPGNEIRQKALFHRWKCYYAWHAARLLERQKKKKEAEDVLEKMEQFLFESAFGEYRFTSEDSLYLVDIPAR